MWFSGAAEVFGAEQFNLKSFGPPRLSWNSAAQAEPIQFDVHFWDFVFATMRTSITGTRAGVREALASIGLATACASQILRLQDNPSEPAVLFMNDDFELVKDFLGNAIRGTIGASVAYMAMQALGYRWIGHWEDCIGGTKPVGARPDFVFASSSAVCLVDAKGSSRSDSDIETEIKASWREQIRGHLGIALALGGTPTEGRVICTQLSGRRPMALTVAYGSLPPTGSSSTPPVASASAVASVIRANFHGVLLAIRATRMREDSPQQFKSYFEDEDASTQASNFPLLALVDLVHQHMAYIEGVGRVSLSGLVGTLDCPDGVWAIRLFCHERALKALFSIAGQAPSSLEFPTFEPIRARGETEKIVLAFSTGEVGVTSDDVVVMGSDGVGALFKRLEDAASQ
jgi:hypothetical protein